MEARACYYYYNKERNSFQDSEEQQTNRFITEQTMGYISDFVPEEQWETGDGDKRSRKGDPDQVLMPPPLAKGIVASPGLGLKDTIQVSRLIAATNTT